MLLGLGRGSGAAVDRRHAARTTRRGAARCWACAARSPTRRAPNWGSTPWHDPHNADRRFTRVRLRTEVLPLLEDVLGGGVAEALARTATALREDTEALDELAAAGAGRGVTGDGARTPSRADGAAGGGPAPGDPRLAAGRRRQRSDRQADPRRRRAGHRLARSGRGGGRRRRCAASG